MTSESQVRGQSSTAPLPTVPTLYLEGEHTPVTAEMTVAKLPVEGELPRELAGMFCRNSPNPQFPPLGKYHWFDGDGMIHAVRFEDGQATYRNRYIHTAGFLKEREAGRALWTGILQPGLPDGPKPPLKDTANTDLIVHRGRLYATWWMSGVPMEIDVDDLSTRGPERFNGALTGNMCAHPKVDPRTGELVFFEFQLLKSPFMRYGVVDKEGALVTYEDIEIPTAHIQHDCALTENYSVLIDLPLGWDMAALMAGKRRITFDREVPARFGILPRHGRGADLRWFEAESCYVYHTINAYEDGDDVVVLGCRVKDLIPEVPNPSPTQARLDTIELSPVLYQWRFNMKTGAIVEGPLDDVATEFPRVNDTGLGRRLRYSYNPRVAQRADLMFDGLIKYDLEKGTNLVLDYEPGWYGSEATFAPRPGAPRPGLGADSEDDGWLVTILTKAGEGAKAVVIDAKTMQIQAKITLPQQVPVGFHAEWVPTP